MFFKSNKNTVPALLEEGTSWVERLEIAASVTEDEAILLEAEASTIAANAKKTRKVAEEGRTVAANFRKMFVTK